MHWVKKRRKGTLHDLISIEAYQCGWSGGLYDVSVDFNFLAAGVLSINLFSSSCAALARSSYCWLRDVCALDYALRTNRCISTSLLMVFGDFLFLLCCLSSLFSA